jgi:hypothetical protein
MLLLIYIYQCYDNFLIYNMHLESIQYNTYQILDFVKCKHPTYSAAGQNPAKRGTRIFPALRDSTTKLFEQIFKLISLFHPF